jgi:hypothetical protein
VRCSNCSISQNRQGPSGVSRGCKATGRRCNINFAGPHLETVDESLTLRRVRGRPPLVLPALEPGFSARQRREGPKPLSLSQDYQATGAIGRSDAWRAWIGPPEGASDGYHCRPSTSPVHDHRIHLRPPISIVSEPGLPRPARRLVMAMTTSCGACRFWMRYTLEDGVANAEAPSSKEGSLRRIFKFARRVLASARTGTEGNTTVAPKTDASSVYGLTGH